MKKILALVLALCMMIPFAAAMAEGEATIRLGQVDYAAHGTKCFAVLTVAMQGDTIVAAHIDEFQFLTKEEGVTGVPNSDADFGASFPEGKVLASKRANSEYYSAMMAKANSTVDLTTNYAAIEAFVTGKTIAELEAALEGKTPEQMVDVVSGSTLVDTMGYVQGLIEAAKAAQ